MLKLFLEDESGATAIEYGLIAALISVAVISGASLVATAVSDQQGTVADTIRKVDVNEGATAP